MKREYLVDLDELVLRCQSATARESMAEAVDCYRVGAFRSCIVATWNAVVWDFLDKLNSLKSQKDAAAVALLEKWEKASPSQEKSDIGFLLEFEKSLPEQAWKAFEFVSEFEHTDLERLREDRNRCAHPSFSRPEEIYRPSAELARAHMIHAVEYLLQNPPTQGKAALVALLERVISPYFPTPAKEAKEYLENSSLARPRQSFLRDFVIVLLKCLLLEDHEKEKRQRWAAALKATFQMHRKDVLQIWQEKLPTFLQQIPEDKLGRGVSLLVVVPECWDYWPQERKEHWKRYVLNLPESDVDFILFYCLQLPELREVGIQKIKTLDEKAVNTLLFTASRVGMTRLPPEVVERALTLWKEASNFDAANRLARNTLPVCVPLLTQEMIEGALQAVKTNRQLQRSTALEAFLLSMRTRDDVDTAKFDQMAREADLSEMVNRWNGIEPQKQDDFKED